MAHPQFEAVNLISDPIHGYIELTKRVGPARAGSSGLPAEDVAEEDLLDTGWLQRMRRISQLQSARWVFPTAEHSRFSHGLGVMHEAGLWGRALYPTLREIIDWHQRGTRYGIRVDTRDGLLFAGEAGVQLTWMDAKVGDWVVTPRTGKAVEINALWINALHTAANFAHVLLQPSEGYHRLAEKAARNFQKFWNPERQCCFDVIDTPSAVQDPAIRPNQIFAVSLPVSPLTTDQQRGVVDILAQQLLTSHGLRSLAPSEPGYRGHYAGGPRERDSACVQHRGKPAEDGVVTR